MAYGTLKLKPDEFWRMTINELYAMQEGYIQVQEYRAMQDKWFMWSQENLHRSKRLPSFKIFMAEQRASARKVEGEEAKELQEQHADIISAYKKQKGKG